MAQTGYGRGEDEGETRKARVSRGSSGGVSPAFCPSAFFPPQAAILPPVDCDYILSYSIHSLTLLFALLNMLSHCCVVLACSVAPN